jgi:hypothetical protein
VKVALEDAEAEARVGEAADPEDLLRAKVVEHRQQLGSEEAVPAVLRDHDVAVARVHLGDDLVAGRARDACGGRDPVLETRLVQRDVEAVGAVTVLELHHRDARLVACPAHAYRVPCDLVDVARLVEARRGVDDHVDDYEGCAGFTGERQCDLLGWVGSGVGDPLIASPRVSIIGHRMWVMLRAEPAERHSTWARHGRPGAVRGSMLS